MKPGWKRFILGILSPLAVALALFAGAVFGVILPELEQSTIERKREMIRELTVSAWGIFDECERQARAGLLDPAAARELAREQVRHLRYGASGKEYFWITDLSPRMIMHPYRPDLEGQDLSTFADPDGTHPFLDFARIARERGEGYAAYRWQVHDEADHVSSKLSYIKFFAPWGWIIGTGLYVDDVRVETRRQMVRLAGMGLGILGLAVLPLLVLARQGYRIERERQEAERLLRDSEQRHRLLVESAGEGMLVARAGRILFMNRPLRALLRLPDGAALPERIDEVFDAGVPPEAQGPATVRLRGADGLRMVSVTATRIPEDDEERLYVIRDRSPEPPRDPAAAWSRSGAPGALADLLEAVRRAAGPDAIRAARQQLAPLIRDGLEQGLHGSLLARQVAEVSDAAVRNCCARALAKLGPAPVPFAFLAFGSEARREAGLLTDQDNGLIFEDPSPEKSGDVAAYFEAFAGFVCGDLAEAGYPLCRGGLMATNPAWRMSASSWRAAVRSWGGAGSDEALKGLNVAADHRCVFGDEALGGILREALQSASQGSQVFFFNLARAALGYRPPVEALGRWSPDAAGTLDLKAALVPTVNLARIYAVRHNLALVSTPARLRALAQQGGLPAQEVDALVGGFELLLRLRLGCHLTEEDGDALPLSRLSELDHGTLRHALELSARMQNHLRMDFCAMQV